jgi:ubiquitin-protein ligase
MNISFNTVKTKKVGDTTDIVKEQINFFKLRIDEANRYITGFEIFSDDSLFMCYVDDKEIEIKYNNNKIIDIDCYQDEEITKQLKSLMIDQNNICENLVVFNQYFESIDVDTSSDSSEEIKNAKFKIPNFETINLPANTRTRSRLQKIFETEDEDVLHEMDSDNDSTTKAIKRFKYDTSSDSEKDSDSESDSEEQEYTKESKPVKFTFNIETKKIIPDLADEIIITDDNDIDNYISFDIINNSKKGGKNATVHQIINEINKAIKGTKNTIIKPINTVFEIQIDNKFNNDEFKYMLKMPDRYPFAPPVLSVKSNLNQSFTYALNNCEILNETKWNPSTTLKDIIVGIYNNIEKLDINTLKSQIVDQKFYETTTKLLELTNTEPLNSKSFNLNFDFLKIQDKTSSKGVGYDHSGPAWDVNAYLKIQDEKNKQITKLLNEIKPLISLNKEVLNDTCVIPYIRQYIYDVSIFEVEKRKEYYEVLFGVFNEIYKLEKYNEHFNIQKIADQYDTFSDYPTIQCNIPKIEKVKTEVDTKDYVSVMTELSFGNSDIIAAKRFKFMDKATTKFTTQEFTKRLGSEIKNLSKNLPISETSSIFLRTDESNMSIMKFLIIPHPDTPYAYGCFEFDMYLPYDYPQNPPHVEIITTGGGKFRFNPNLYDNGKVCLSLLGTWSGHGGEKWTPNSTILQVLLSIQSLIFCEEPYFNEPGYERDRGNARGKESNDRYNEPVRINTLKLAMIDQLKYPSYGFEEVIKNHFKLKQNDIFKKLDEWKKISKTPAFDAYYKELKELISKL